MPTPLKRHIALQPISREHHYGLLLSYKLRMGFKLQVDPARMKAYADWFWEHYLESHFDFEEEKVFPLLGSEHPLIKKAVGQHHSLRRLFIQNTSLETVLKSIEREVVEHIRLEERQLFTELQRVVSEDQLLSIQEAHVAKGPEDWKDEFWVAK